MERNTVIGKIKWSVIGGSRAVKSQRQITGNQSKIQAGFSLLELMIAMFILIILLSVAVPAYRNTIQQARETVLQENLWQMRRAIDQYGADKGKLPQSLDDLVQGGYLREKPVDPITEEANWEEIQGDNVNPDDGQGVIDVKSKADGEDSAGKKYEDY